MYLDNELLGQGICADLAGKEKEEAWLVRVAHICKVANDAGVSVVIESASGPGDSVRRIIGENMLTTGR
jgi:adenylylsulfate kinase-like enzyme